MKYQIKLKLIFYELSFSATIKQLLRRTLVLKVLLCSYLNHRVHKAKHKVLQRKLCVLCEKLSVLCGKIPFITLIKNIL